MYCKVFNWYYCYYGFKYWCDCFCRYLIKFFKLRYFEFLDMDVVKEKRGISESFVGIIIWGVNVNGVFEGDFVVVYVVEFFGYMGNFSC